MLTTANSFSSPSDILDDISDSLNKVKASITGNELSSNLKMVATLDTSKLSMLKEISQLLIQAKPIEIKFSTLEVDGEIQLKSDKGVATKDISEMLKNPIFMNILKSAIKDADEKYKSGGKL